MIIITESIMYERNDSGESSCVINTRSIIEINIILLAGLALVLVCNKYYYFDDVIVAALGLLPTSY